MLVWEVCSHGGGLSFLGPLPPCSEHWGSWFTFMFPIILCKIRLPYLILWLREQGRADGRS